MSTEDKCKYLRIINNEANCDGDLKRKLRKYYSNAYFYNNFIKIQLLFSQCEILHVVKCRIWLYRYVYMEARNCTLILASEGY